MTFFFRLEVWCFWVFLVVTNWTALSHISERNRAVTTIVYSFSKDAFRNLCIVICKTYNFAIRTKFFSLSTIIWSYKHECAVVLFLGRRTAIREYWQPGVIHIEDAGDKYPHVDWLVHFVVLLAELLVAEKLRVHAFQGLLRVLLRLFDACFLRRGEEKRQKWAIWAKKRVKKCNRKRDGRHP